MPWSLGALSTTYDNEPIFFIPSFVHGPPYSSKGPAYHYCWLIPQSLLGPLAPPPPQSHIAHLHHHMRHYLNQSGHTAQTTVDTAHITNIQQTTVSIHHYTHHTERMDGT